MAFALSFSGVFNEESLNWTRRAHELKNNLPPAYHPWIEIWYACFISQDIGDVRRNCNLKSEAAVHSRFLWFDLAVTYTNFLDDYAKALTILKEMKENSIGFNKYLWKDVEDLERALAKI